MTIAWGALAFGGVYPWASWPLMVGCVTTTALSWLLVRGPGGPGPVAAAMVAVSAAIAIQLVPLGASVMAWLSPTTLAVWATLEGGSSAVRHAHPLSIAPVATWQALALFVTFCLFVGALSRLFAATGTRWIVTSLTVLGVVMALFGMGQKAAYQGRLYGFWVPQMSGSPFGPFVNRNHFAGWMLMVLPLTLAYLCASVARGLRHVPPTTRDRLLWLGSREASELILFGAAAAVMGLALVMTMSRSGMSALVLGLALTGFFVSRGIRARSGRSVAGVYLIGLVALITLWVGTDVVASRFAESEWTQFNGRRGAWADARDIAERFPLAGTGLNTYGVATTFFQRHELQDHFEQAHNDYFQLAAEGGLLVLIPATVLLIAIAATAWRRMRDGSPNSFTWWARAGAVTGIVCIGFQETVDFSLQMPGNAVMLAVLVAIALHSRPART